MAEVSSAKSTRVASGRKAKFVAGYDRWLQPADRRVFAPFGTDFGDNQERRGGQDVHLPEGGCVGQFQRELALAGPPVRANRGDTLPDEGQPRQLVRRCIMQGKNPSPASLQVLACADKGLQERHGVRLRVQKRSPFIVRENIMAVVDRL